MSNCLVFSNNKSSFSTLNSLLNNLKIDDVICTNSINEAKKLLNNRLFDLVLINSMLDDKQYNFITYIYENTSSGIILLVKNDLLDESIEKFNKLGVMCIAKPIDKNIFKQSINIALVTQNRIKGIPKIKVYSDKVVDDSDLISRAKYVLMDYLNMSESDAHHYIEKKAMDNRISKVKAAKDILKIYG